MEHADRGIPPYRLCQRLKILKVHLNELNRRHYSNIQHLSSQARYRLHHIQEQLRECLGNPDLKDQERLALADLVLFSGAEESLLR